MIFQIQDAQQYARDCPAATGIDPGSTASGADYATGHTSVQQSCSLCHFTATAAATTTRHPAARTAAASAAASASPAATADATAAHDSNSPFSSGSCGATADPKCCLPAVAGAKGAAAATAAGSTTAAAATAIGGSAAAAASGHLCCRWHSTSTRLV